MINKFNKTITFFEFNSEMPIEWNSRSLKSPHVHNSTFIKIWMSKEVAEQYRMTKIK